MLLAERAKQVGEWLLWCANELNVILNTLFFVVFTEQNKTNRDHFYLYCHLTQHVLLSVEPFISLK